MLTRPAFWILLTLVSLAAAGVGVRYFPQAFSIVALDITMNRDQALAAARAIMTRDRLGPVRVATSRFMRARESSDRAAAAWLTIVVVSLVAAFVLSAAVISHVAIPGDKSLLALATSWSAWKTAWDVLSTIGNYPMIPLGLGFVAWLWWTKHRREAVLVFVILAAATIGSEATKAIVARDRPSGPVPGIPGVVYSYPSGHALEDVMILGMLSVRLWRSEQARWLVITAAAPFEQFVRALARPAAAPGLPPASGAPDEAAIEALTAAAAAHGIEFVGPPLA